MPKYGKKLTAVVLTLLYFDTGSNTLNFNGKILASTADYLRDGSKLPSAK